MNKWLQKIVRAFRVGYNGLHTQIDLIPYACLLLMAYLTGIAVTNPALALSSKLFIFGVFWTVAILTLLAYKFFLREAKP
jgi:hypothetical protein